MLSVPADWRRVRWSVTVHLLDNAAEFGGWERIKEGIDATIGVGDADGDAIGVIVEGGVERVESPLGEGTVPWQCVIGQPAYCKGDDDRQWELGHSPGHLLIGRMFGHELWADQSHHFEVADKDDDKGDDETENGSHKVDQSDEEVFPLLCHCINLGGNTIGLSYKQSPRDRKK